MRWKIELELGFSLQNVTRSLTPRSVHLQVYVAGCSPSCTLDFSTSARHIRLVMHYGRLLLADKLLRTGDQSHADYADLTEGVYIDEY